MLLRIDGITNNIYIEINMQWNITDGEKCQFTPKRKDNVKKYIDGENRRSASIKAGRWSGEALRGENTSEGGGGAKVEDHAEGRPEGGSGRKVAFIID